MTIDLKLVDTHCHLTLPDFEGDLDQVLERAFDHGVGKIVVPGIDLESSRKAVDLAIRFQEVFAAVGVHPNEADRWEPGDALQLRRLAAHERVVAIGEIGLDYYRHRAAPSLQKEAFRAQLELAAELSLPIIVHNRKADDDLMAELRAWRQASGVALRDRAGVLHAFSGTADFARRGVALGFFLGLGGPITYRASAQAREAAAVVPLEALLLETDAPFLSPHPHRGRRNEPGYVSLVAAKIAEIRGLPTADITRATSQNAARLFSWDHGNHNRNLH